MGKASKILTCNLLTNAPKNVPPKYPELHYLWNAKALKRLPVFHFSMHRQNIPSFRLPLSWPSVRFQLSLWSRLSLSSEFLFRNSSKIIHTLDSIRIVIPRLILIKLWYGNFSCLAKKDIKFQIWFYFSNSAFFHRFSVAKLIVRDQQ